MLTSSLVRTLETTFSRAGLGALQLSATPVKAVRPHLPALFFFNKNKHRSVTWGPKHVWPELVSHQLPKKFSLTWSQLVRRSCPNTVPMRKAETVKGLSWGSQPNNWRWGNSDVAPVVGQPGPLATQALWGSQQRWPELGQRELAVSVYKDLPSEHVHAKHGALGNPHSNAEGLRDWAFNILQVEGWDSKDKWCT